jgi:hypothetical protein
LCIRLNCFYLFNQRLCISRHLNPINLKKISDIEWEKLKNEIEQNSDAWDKALQSKKQEWKTLKSAGILDDLIDENVSQEKVEYVDKLSLKLKLRNRLQKSLKNITKNEVEVKRSEAVENINLNIPMDRSLEYLKNKFTNLISQSNSTAVTLYSFLNEVKDKKCYDNELIENIVFSFARLKSAAFALSAFKIYMKLCSDGFIQQNNQFLVQYVNTLYINNITSTASTIQHYLIENNTAMISDFFIGELCSLILKSISSQPSKNNQLLTDSDDNLNNSEVNHKSPMILRNKKKMNNQPITSIKPVKSMELNDKMNLFYQNIKKYSLSDVSI